MAQKKQICTCGKTKTPPYCDHSHEHLEAAAGKKVLCTCGKTKTPPYCDHSHESLHACPVKITPIPNKILLIMLPYWDPLIPPQGISQLKAYLQKRGYIVKTDDANMKEEFKKFYNRYFDVFRKYIPGDKHGNFFNIGHEVMRNHMIAHINYKNEKEYLELVKTIIYNTFYTHVNDGRLKELKRLLDEFYKLLTDYMLHLLIKERPAVLGISVLQDTVGPSLFAFKLTRERYPLIKTVMGGGVFADTHAPGTPNFEALLEETKDYVDKIIVGQGEKLFYKYLEGGLPSRRVYSKDDINGEVLDFSCLEHADFSDFDIGDYPYLAAAGSASCPYQCGFCNVVSFQGAYRAKDIQQAAEDMTGMYKKYGHQLFFMTDALLNPIITDLAKEFIEKGISLYYDAYFRVDEASGDIDNTLLWRRGGLYRVRLGVESGSQRILDLMNKDITPDMTRASLSALAYAGIKTTAYWVIGYPGETEADFQETLKLLEELQNDIFQAECNPFLCHFSGQGASASWTHKRKSLYPDKTDDMLIFKTWSVEVEPSREETYDRLFRFVNRCKELGIPNPYSLNEHFKADSRWKQLHKNAVPPLINFRNKGSYIDESRQVKKLHFLEKQREDAYEFGF